MRIDASGAYEVLLYGHPVEVKVTFYAPEVPGVFDKLPEDCYPFEEAEVDWVADTGNSLLDYFINNVSYTESKIIEIQLLKQIIELNNPYA